MHYSPFTLAVGDFSWNSEILENDTIKEILEVVAAIEVSKSPATDEIYGR